MSDSKIADMYVYRFEEDDYIDVWFMGDMHLGHEGFNLKEFKRYVEWVKSADNRYIIGMGDYIECATRSGAPGKALLSQSISITGQVEVFVKLLEPVKDRIICLLAGNHEERIAKEGFDIVAQAIAPRLNTVYLGYEHWVKLKGLKRHYNLYIHHGPSTTATSSMFHIEKLLKAGFGVADLIAMGHNHRLFVNKYNTPMVVGDTVRKHTCWALRTGGFLDYPSYARKKLYEPADIGSPIVRFYFDKKGIAVYSGLEHYNGC